MDKKSAIILIGLPGSGKSTIARLLSRRLGIPLVDLDQMIESEIGMPIRDYFEKNGEPAFRLVEAEVLQSVSQRTDRLVLATGGGVVLRAENRQVLQGGWVVYLSSHPKDLVRRLRNDQVRPLLQGVDAYKTLMQLYAVRHPLYSELADVVVVTVGRSASQIATELITTMGSNFN